MAEGASDSWLEYCLHTTRDYHYDLYLSSLRAKTLPVSHAMTLLALHHEIDKIPYITTEVTLAMIRLQWWQDALVECTQYAKDPSQPPPRSHPITHGLNAFFHAKDPTERDAYSSRIQQYLEAETTRSTEALRTFKQFGEQQAARYGVLHCLLSGSAEPSEPDRLIGECYGCLREILALPQQLAANQVTLPPDILQKHEVNTDQYGNDGFKSACQHMVRDIAVRCEQLVKQLPKDIKGKNRYLYIRSIQLRSVLNRLQKADYNILERNIPLTTPWSALALWLRC